MLSYLKKIEKRYKLYQPSLCSTSSSKNCIGGWFYHIQEKSAEQNADFALAHGWNYTFLPTNLDSEYSRTMLFKTAIALRERNIDVHLICLDDPSYIDNPISAYHEISEILKYVNAIEFDLRGIYIDCSPTSKKEWYSVSDEERNEIFKNYLKVLEYGRKAINDFRPQTTFSGGIAWWLLGDAKNGELEYGRGYDLVNKDRLDIIIPMIDGTGGSIDKVIEYSEDFFLDKASTAIGISVEDYDYSDFDDVLHEIRGNRKDSKYYKGISIFANYLYPDWNSTDREFVEDEEEEEEEEVDNRLSLCQSSSPKNCTGAWFYALHEKDAEVCAEYAVSHGWNYVLLSAQYTRELLRRNIIAFRKRNIDVHVLCVEDQRYLDNPAGAYEEIADILKFVNENNLDIQGISIDCEPHDEDIWNTGDVELRNTMFEKYLKVIEEGRNAINDYKPNMIYSAAVSAWYAPDGKINELKHGRGFDLVNEDRLDVVIPMMYDIPILLDGSGDTADKIIKLSEDYFDDRVPTVIGLSVVEHDYSIFNELIEQVRNKKKGNKYFYGMCIFGNHLYPDWKSFEGGALIEEGGQLTEEGGQLIEEEVHTEVTHHTMCHKSSFKDCLGGWFYEIHKKPAKRNAEFASDHGWNYVLLTTNVDSHYSKQLLVNNTLAFREKNIDVHLMCLEDPSYIDNPISAYREISKILKYVNEKNLDIQGIHIDCKPTDKKEWYSVSEKERNKIFKKYLKVLEYGRKAINDFRPQTTFSGGVAWWLSGDAKSGELEYGRGYDLVNEDRLDLIIPMIFNGSGGSIEKIIEYSEDFLSDKVSTSIGISVEDYDYNEFDDFIQEIKDNRKDNKYFKGICVFANIVYPDWNDY